MTPLLLTLLTPVAGALALVLLRSLRLAGWVNLAVSVICFATATWLAWSVASGGEVAGMSFRVDSFNVSVAAGILLYEVRRQQGFPEFP